MCGGSRIPNGNLNVPLNKGSRKKQYFLHFGLILSCSRVDVHVNFHICAQYDSSGFTV